MKSGKADFSEPVVLGRTGLKVGRLGLASSYGAPSKAFEEAFEQGCNYFVWNSFMRGRRNNMRDAIRNIIRKGQRDKLVIALHAYAHIGFLNSKNVRDSLKILGTDYIDIMLLGYYSSMPGHGIIRSALKLKQKGLIHYAGLTGHNRKLFPRLDAEGQLDVFHVRYNAANRGAEQDVFPHLKTSGRSGVVAFTATRWGQLLKESKMPDGEKPLSAVDCYRFALSHPAVDVCLTGPSTREEMHRNLSVLKLGPLTPVEMDRIRSIGDHVYGKKRS